MPRAGQPRIIFITGTDTSVGKTVLTSLLLSHLRQSGSFAFAIKPFCSGGRGDAKLLHDLQDGALSLDEINPFHFPEPLAPLVAARKHRRPVLRKSAFAHIQSVAARIALAEFDVQNSPRCRSRSTILIEGAGGLLAPLGEADCTANSRYRKSKYFTALDMITALDCRVIVVAPNRLGVINHTLLTLRALNSPPLDFPSKVVLMDLFHPQHSTPDTHSNPSILTELIAPIPLFRIPYLTKNPSKPERIHQFAKKCKKTLAQILA